MQFHYSCERKAKCVFQLKTKFRENKTKFTINVELCKFNSLQQQKRQIITIIKNTVINNLLMKNGSWAVFCTLK